jgi:predicted DNA-binding transcriptional regulator YafY
MRHKLAKLVQKYENFVKELTLRPQRMEDLAQHFNVSLRTVFRYLDQIKASEPHLKCEVDPARGNLYFIDKPQVKMNSHETQALGVLAQELENSGNISGAATLKYVLEAMSELSKKVPNELVELTKKYYSIDHGPFAEHDLVSNHKKIEKVLKAIDAHKQLKINYRKNNKIEQIQFQPYRIVLRVGKLYLLGAKQENPKDLIVLAWKKITMVEQVAKVFPIKLKAAVKDVYDCVFGQFLPSLEQKAVGPSTLKLLIHEEWVCDYLKNTFFNPEATFEKALDSDKMICTLKLYETPDLVAWLSGQSPHFEVLEPISLREQIRARIAQSFELYK